MANEFIARNGLIAQNNSTVTGSLEVTQGITGSLLGTASYATQALTASYASTYAPVFPYTGSAIITGSLEITGSIRALVTGSDFVNIGNAVTASQRLVRIGQDTAWVDIGSLVGATSFGALYFNQPTPSSTNFTILANATQTVFNGTTSLTLRVNNGNAVNFTQTSTQFNTVAAASSGAVIPYSFASISNTNQTTTTNIPNFQITGNNKQWATGTVANQYWNYLTSNTASFVGASTMTNSYGLFVEAATAGTNATITNNYAAGFSGSVNIVTGNINLLNTTSSTTGVITKAGVRFIHDFAAAGTTGQNTWVGQLAGNFILSGSSIGGQGSANVAVGYNAAAGTTNGNYNTIMGHNAAVGITTGGFNVVLGRLAGGAMGAGSGNIYIGEQAAGSNVGSNNVVIGQRAGLSGASFSSIVAIGQQAGQSYTASNGVFIGTFAAQALTTGTGNTAVGWYASANNQTGTNNTALGHSALQTVLNVNNNTGVGYLAGSSITSGSENTTVGSLTMQLGSAGATGNTAMGYSAFRSGKGNNNTVIGYNAGGGTSNTANFNTLIGNQSGAAITTGAQNTAVGGSTLNTNQTGTSNTAIGWGSLLQATSTGNSCVGSYTFYDLTSGGQNIGIGYDTGRGITTGTYNIIIGNNTTGFASAMSNNILFATDNGVARFRYNPMPGSNGVFQFTPASTTGQTASTEIPIFRVNSANTQLSTGALTTQRFTYLPSQTLAFAGASTATNVYGLFAEAAIAGTNATITNNYAAGFSGSVQIKAESIPGQGIVIRNLVGSTTNSAIYMGVSPSSTNYAIRADASGNNFINGGQLFLCVGGTSQVVMNGASIAFQSNNIQSSGATIQYQFSPVTNTGQTASTEIPLFNINSATTTWLTGNITTQRNIWFKTRTLNFGGASTVTSSYGLYVEAATAGALATITNNYAAGFSGSVQILTGGLNVTGSVNASSFTGSLLGTASYATQALTASYASTYAPVFPFTGSAIITGSLEVTGSITSTEGFTGSFQGDGSGLTGITAAPAGPDKSIQFNDAGATSGSGDFTFDKSLNIAYLTGSLEVTNGITGSLYGTATSASYINGSIIKSNSVPPGMFGGTPLTTSITFTADFPNPSYSVTITGEDARIFTIQNKSATGFEINTNSNIALTGNTYWHAISYGEFNS
jgi:hypothetical protein